MPIADLACLPFSSKTATIKSENPFESNNHAISLKELNNYKKSLEYFDLALKQLDKLEKENYPTDKILKSRISLYNNIGRVYEKMKKYIF